MVNYVSVTVRLLRYIYLIVLKYVKDIVQYNILNCTYWVNDEKYINVLDYINTKL